MNKDNQSAPPEETAAPQEGATKGEAVAGEVGVGVGVGVGEAVVEMVPGTKVGL